MPTKRYILPTICQFAVVIKSTRELLMGESNVSELNRVCSLGWHVRKETQDENKEVRTQSGEIEIKMKKVNKITSINSPT